MEPYETEEYKGYTLEVVQDDFDVLGNPFEEWSQLGHVVMDSSVRYVPSNHSGKANHWYMTLTLDYETWEEAIPEWLNPGERIGQIIPFRLDDYGSSGWWLSVGKPGTMPDESDNGFIYVSRDELLKEYKSKILSKSVKEYAAGVLKSELEVWRRWMNGEVYGFLVKDAAGEVIDACGGFYDTPEYVMSEARDVADHYARTMAEKHAMALTAGL